MWSPSIVLCVTMWLHCQSPSLRHVLTILSFFAGTSVGMSTDEGAVLEPHQVAVDHQELKRLHRLMGAMLGGSVSSS